MLLTATCCVPAILGFHSMMNQDQYHASLLNKGQPVGLGWDGITKATKPKVPTKLTYTHIHKDYYELSVPVDAQRT